MPPADQNAPTPAPAPETPKPEKVGFFAKLFGKKPKEEAVPAVHESLAPPAQLGESTGSDVPAPFVTPAGPVAPTPAASPEDSVPSEMPSMPESNPAEEEEEKLPTLDVPPSISADTPKTDDGMAVPPVPGTPPSAEPTEEPKDPFAPKV